MTRFLKKPSASGSNEPSKKSCVSMHVDFCNSQNIVIGGENKWLLMNLAFVVNVTNFFKNMLLANEIKMLSSNCQTIKLL